MRNPYTKSGNGRVIFYAICMAVVVGVAAVVVQDINVPTEHVSQKITLNLEG